MHRKICLPQIITCTRAVAAIEFALCLPVFIVLLIGVAEISRLALIHQKLDRAANTLADLVTRGETVGTQELSDLSGAAERVMEPFTLDTPESGIVVSSVTNIKDSPPPCDETTNPCIVWTYSKGAGLTKLNGGGSLPNGYVLPPNQNVIVAEISYEYEPMLAASSNFLSSLKPQQLYKVAMYKPRAGTLMNLIQNQQP